ncbi:MAG: glutathione S-transferase [Gammaproteobacteria bacterium]
MLLVHHLENSRSQRVLWLLEELELDYEVKRYERDPQSGLAPKALMDIHPLGKSPVIEDDGVVLAETGAIIEHIVDAHGGGRLVPARGTSAYHRYRYWMHAAEGSYMPPLVMALILNRIATAPMPFFARPVAKGIVKAVHGSYLDHTTKGLMEYLDAELEKGDWLAGDELTAADIIMSFPAEAALTRIDAARSARNIRSYVDRLHARPAYRRALERGGPYAYA